MNAAVELDRHCGVCDVASAEQVCATCREPVCPAHAVGVRDAAGATVPVCLVCFQDGRGLEGARLARESIHRFAREELRHS